MEADFSFVCSLYAFTASSILISDFYYYWFYTGIFHVFPLSSVIVYMIYPASN